MDDRSPGRVGLMKLVGKTVLVTGGTGFIGSRLVEKLILEQQAHVRVLVRTYGRASRIARFPVEMVPGNLTDVESVRRATRGCDVIFNCAYDFAADREHQKRSSMQAARNLGEAALRETVRRLVHVSTSAVYAPMPDGDLTEASGWPKSTNPYVLIKRELERLLLDQHKTRGLPAVVVQPTLVYGPFSRDWTIGPIQQLTSGYIPLVDQGTGLCNPVYIDDVIDAMILAATAQAAVGERFLISGDKPLTWKEFYEPLESLLGTKATIEITEQELSQEIARRQRDSALSSRLRNLMRNREVAEVVRTLPAVSTFVAVAKKILRHDQWESLKSRFVPNGSPIFNGHGAATKPLHIPSELLLQMYKSKTRVRIDKARALLGYSPKFDFERGMNVTAEFLRWANLV
jgi:nucleoside-diphosphate-sugar epimerase